jgi:lysophospholipase L1-like esterase
MVIRTLFSAAILAAALAESAETRDATKIVCFGDSITAAGYPQVLGQMLGVEVVNAGKGGHTSAMGLRRMQKDVLDLRPAAVVIFFGTNDSRLAEPQVHVPVEKYAENLTAMVNACRKIGAQPVLCTLPPINPEPYFKRHARENFDAAGGMEKVLQQYRAAALRVAETEKVPVVDLNRLLAKQPEWMAADGVHPTPQGRTIIARSVAEVVAPLLQIKIRSQETK